MERLSAVEHPGGGECGRFVQPALLALWHPVLSPSIPTQGHLNIPARGNDTLLSACSSDYQILLLSFGSVSGSVDSSLGKVMGFDFQKAMGSSLSHSFLPYTAWYLELPINIY